MGSYDLTIPRYILDGLIRYRDQHLRPGGFITAILENDLTDAVTRADSLCYTALADIVSWCKLYLPAHSWGSHKRVEKWLSVSSSTIDKKPPSV